MAFYESSMLKNHHEISQGDNNHVSVQYQVEFEIPTLKEQDRNRWLYRGGYWYKLCQGDIG